MAQSKNRKSAVSELEGAILGEIARGAATAYAVRAEFATSPSTALRASKGAIYPAIARLVAAGLIAARAVSNDRRGTQTLRLTTRGEKAMREWASDAVAAAGAGLDPFRLRSGHWRYLPHIVQAALYGRLRNAICSRISMLEKRRAAAGGDPDGVRAGLEIGLQQSRLDFLDGLAAPKNRSRRNRAAAKNS